MSNATKIKISHNKNIKEVKIINLDNEKYIFIVKEFGNHWLILKEDFWNSGFFDKENKTLIINKNEASQNDEFLNWLFFNKDNIEKNINSIYIEITDLCDLKCKNCIASIDKKNTPIVHLTIEQLQSLLRTLEKMNFKHIILGGGEPTLHPNIYDMVKLIKEYKENYFYLTIKSNGHFDIKKNLNLIKDFSDYIVWDFSIDGWDLKSVALTRCGSNLDKINKSTNFIHNNALLGSCNVTIRLENIGNEELIIKQAIELGFKTISFTLLLTNNKNFLLSGKTVFDFYIRILNLIQKYSEVIKIKTGTVCGSLACLINGGKINNFNCTAGKSLKMDIKGDIYPCPYFNNNIITNFFKNPELLNFKLIQKLCKNLENIRKHKTDQSCIWKNVCGGGCFASAINYKNIKTIGCECNTSHCEAKQEFYKLMLNSLLSKNV